MSNGLQLAPKRVPAPESNFQFAREINGGSVPWRATTIMCGEERRQRSVHMQVQAATAHKAAPSCAMKLRSPIKNLVVGRGRGGG